MFAQLMPSLLIGLAGAFGTLLRYWIGLATDHWNVALPWGTMLINITGSFLIVFFGDLTALESKFPLSETTRTIIMVGLCVGYTTFSSFSTHGLYGFIGHTLCCQRCCGVYGSRGY